MKALGSCATGLRCIDCGAEQPLAYRLACAACGGLLEPVYDLEPLRRAGPDAAFTGRGVWRYHPVLPVQDPAHFVSLGEGGRHFSMPRPWPASSGCDGSS